MAVDLISRPNGPARDSNSITPGSITHSANGSTNSGPAIRSLRDLHILSEVFDQVADQRVFLHCSFYVLGEDYVAYFGQSKKSKFDLTVHDILEDLKRIPDHEIYPPAPTTVTTFTKNINSEFHVKSAKLLDYEDWAGKNFLADLCLGEVEILETLRQHPHPTIVKYHGCLVKRGRIVGIVLDRYKTRLFERVQNAKPGDFDYQACIEAIETGVKHLHSLGLAHNDLNPYNIMLNDLDSPRIIDFGSCRPFGNELISGGTPGWVDEFSPISDQKQDESAIVKIRTWMETELASK